MGIWSSIVESVFSSNDDDDDDDDDDGTYEQTDYEKWMEDDDRHKSSGQTNPEGCRGWNSSG